MNRMAGVYRLSVYGNNGNISERKIRTRITIRPRGTDDDGDGEEGTETIVGVVGGRADQKSVVVIERSCDDRVDCRLRCDYTGSKRVNGNDFDIIASAYVYIHDMYISPKTCRERRIKKCRAERTEQILKLCDIITQKNVNHVYYIV